MNDMKQVKQDFLRFVMIDLTKIMKKYEISYIFQVLGLLKIIGLTQCQKKEKPP